MLTIQILYLVLPWQWSLHMWLKKNVLQQPAWNSSGFRLWCFIRSFTVTSSKCSSPCINASGRLFKLLSPTSSNCTYPSAWLMILNVSTVNCSGMVFFLSWGSSLMQKLCNLARTLTQTHYFLDAHFFGYCHAQEAKALHQHPKSAFNSNSKLQMIKIIDTAATSSNQIW